MNELLTDLWASTPPLLKAVGALVIPILTYFAGRRLNHATITEKNATALEITLRSADRLAVQLEKYEESVPGWKAQVAALSAETKTCKETAQAIRDAAEVLVHHVDAMSYWKDPDEPVGPTEKRFIAMKEAGAKIKALLEADSTPKDPPTVI